MPRPRALGLGVDLPRRVTYGGRAIILTMIRNAELAGHADLVTARDVGPEQLQSPQGRGTSVRGILR